MMKTKTVTMFSVYYLISGMHEVLVTNEGEAVRGCPNYVRSMPNSKKDYEGIEPCAVGSTVEVIFLSSIDLVRG